MLSSMNPNKAAYQRIVERKELYYQLSQEPIGVQLKSPLSERYIAILPDASEVGQYRIQYFDPKGFSGHSTYPDPQRALREAIFEGFTVRAPGALEALSDTVSWRLGTEAQSLRDLFNSGKITFEGMITAINKIYQENTQELVPSAA